MVLKVDERKQVVFLSLGSNLGDCKMNLELATRKIESTIGVVVKQSSIYISEAWGDNKQLKEFYNSVIQIETSLTPTALLKRIEEIEREMGRLVKSENRSYKNRVIDIDILLYNQAEISTSKLTIPHKFLTDRLFVLEPLNEISPNFDLPNWGKKVYKALEELKNVNNSKIRRASKNN